MPLLAICSSKRRLLLTSFMNTFWSLRKSTLDFILGFFLLVMKGRTFRVSLVSILAKFLGDFLVITSEWFSSGKFLLIDRVFFPVLFRPEVAAVHLWGLFIVEPEAIGDLESVKLSFIDFVGVVRLPSVVAIFLYSEIFSCEELVFCLTIDKRSWRKSLDSNNCRLRDLLLTDFVFSSKFKDLLGHFPIYGISLQERFNSNTGDGWRKARGEWIFN